MAWTDQARCRAGFLRGRSMFNRARERAAVKGVPFSLCVRDIIRRVLCGRCEVTGIPFVVERNGRGPFAPTIDRISPQRGYVPDNIQVVCWIYNAAKGEGTHEDVMRLARAIVHGAVQIGA
jgi:hypothetical protein